MRYFESEFEYKVWDEPNCKRHFVAGGTTLGFDWFIVNQGGSYPCAYVILRKGQVFNGTPYDEIPIDCHDGLTYGQSYLEGVKLEDGEYVIGWDYAHYGDYISGMEGGGSGGFTPKKWNTTEIVNEVIEVCKQLRELNDKEG